MTRIVRPLTAVVMLGALLVVGTSSFAQKQPKNHAGGNGQKGGDTANKPPAEKTGPYKVGDTVKDFKLADSNGSDAHLSDYSGKTIVMFFFSKDGTAAGEAIPQIQKDIAEGQKAHGVIVLGITTDDAATAKAFVEKHAITFPVLVDKDKEVSKAFAATKTPFCAIVNPKSKLVYGQAGADVKSLIAKIESLVAKKEAKDGKDGNTPPEKKPR
ncbi:MAG: redoxin domain-containing protein [Planctomycetes bacterium]|nr:redoxin domain-containing protein [Planctomycetota bacterium]MBI3846095.1 redoxin domain-containing protein [Planctomycetota bacterium]